MTGAEDRLAALEKRIGIAWEAYRKENAIGIPAKLMLNREGRLIYDLRVLLELDGDRATGGTR